MTESSNNPSGNNPPAGSGAPASASAIPETIAREADALTRKFHELRALQSRTRRTYQFLTGITILMFAVFMYATYSRIHENFNQDAVQSALAKEMPDVMANAGAQLMKAGYAVMPVYRDLLVQRLNTQGPALAAQAQEEFSKVPQEAGESLNTKLQAAFAGALEQIKPELTKAYPNLTDQQKQDLIAASFTKAVNDGTQEVTDHISQQYIGEQARFTDLLNRFDLPPVDSNLDRDAITRSFLHNVVMLIDMNVMQGTDAGGDPNVVPQTGTAETR
jgi:predicted component of type VI protein secretion system